MHNLMPRLAAALSLLAVSLTLSLGQQARAESHVELILDASGSMFNKLADGRYRIVAAKEVLTELIAGLPADGGLNVGLRIYGSQLRGTEPGACEDSRLVVGIDGVARQELLVNVRDAQARGATPIAYSLERAAEDMAGRDGSKVVVLITDGLEVCGGDVNAAAAALKAAGIDLRVIGFDLDAAAAASFAGVGAFENALSAAELLNALNRAVQAAAAPAGAAAVAETATYEVTVSLTREGETVTEGATVTFVPALGRAADGEPMTDEGRGVLKARLASGTYVAHVADAFSDAPILVPGQLVTPEGPNAFTYELAPETAVVLTPETSTPAAGATLHVAWEGAPAAGGEIELGPKGTDANLVVVPARAASGEARLRLPQVTGELELRYVIQGPDGSRLVAGSSLLDVQEVTASLDAPDTAPAGGRVEIGWSGPDGEGDTIAIVEAGAPEGTWWQYRQTSGGNPIVLNAPERPGEYEIRYLDGFQNQTLARRPIAVVAVSASLRVPATALAGTRIAFEVVVGPGNDGDYVTIVPAGTPEGEWWTYTDVTGPGTYEFHVPDVPGEHEIRYVTGAEGLTLAREAITVTPATATVSAPSEVEAETTFMVSWTGPDGNGDYVTIVAVGTPIGEWDFSLNTATGNPLAFWSPAEPGDYELRYMTGESNRLLAMTPIRVR